MTNLLNEFFLMVFCSLILMALLRRANRGHVPAVSGIQHFKKEWLLHPERIYARIDFSLYYNEQNN